MATSAGVDAVALIVNTSRSGRVKRTALLQFRPSPSSHFPDAVLKRTMRLVSGPPAPKDPSSIEFGAGSPPGTETPVKGVQPEAEAPPSQTAFSGTAVVWLPEWKIAA